jgi:hypothetical protein
MVFLFCDLRIHLETVGSERGRENRERLRYENFDVRSDRWGSDFFGRTLEVGGGGQRFCGVESRNIAPSEGKSIQQFIAFLPSILHISYQKTLGILNFQLSSTTSNVNSEQNQHKTPTIPPVIKMQMPLLMLLLLTMLMATRRERFSFSRVLFRQKVCRNQEMKKFLAHKSFCLFHLSSQRIHFCF